MRQLEVNEIAFVAGGESIPIPTDCNSELGDCFGLDPAPTTGKVKKNNNGYGNGAESGPPPGRSGEHNPTLLGDNLGPRGVR